MRYLNIAELKPGEFRIFAAPRDDIPATKSAALGRCEAIIAAADAEDRDLTSDELGRINVLATQFLDSGGDEDDLPELPSRGRQTQPEKPGARQSPRREEIGVADKSKNHLIVGRTPDGASVRGYRTGEPLAGPSDFDPETVGEICRAITLNDHGALPANIRSEVSGGSDTGGGYLLPPMLSSQFIDLARAASVVSRAGAITVPVPGSELIIGKLNSDPTAGWRPETGAITASAPVFGKITLRPKVVATLIPLSIEFLEDATNGAQIITNAVMAALASAIDSAALIGTGAASEPLGVVNSDGTNTQTAIGAPTNYVEVSNAVGSILGANYDGPVSELRWILPPSVAQSYDQLVTGISGDLTPLAKTPWVAELPTLNTTALTTDAIVGRFDQMLLGSRASVQLQVLDAGSVVDDQGETWNAVSQMMRFIRAYVRIDVALARPNWFSVLSDYS